VTTKRSEASAWANLLWEVVIVYFRL
jgi:hypothetical protein